MTKAGSLVSASPQPPLTLSWWRSEFHSWPRLTPARTEQRSRCGFDLAKLAILAQNLADCEWGSHHRCPHGCHCCATAPNFRSPQSVPNSCQSEGQQSAMSGARHQVRTPVINLSSLLIGRNVSRSRKIEINLVVTRREFYRLNLSLTSGEDKLAPSRTRQLNSHRRTIKDILDIVAGLDRIEHLILASRSTFALGARSIEVLKEEMSRVRKQSGGSLRRSVGRRSSWHFRLGTVLSLDLKLAAHRKDPTVMPDHSLRALRCIWEAAHNRLWQI